MKKQATVIAVVVVVIVLAIVVFAMRRSGTNNAPPTPMQQPTASSNAPAQSENASSVNSSAAPSASGPIEIALNAQNSSGETGKAVLTDVNGKTKVELTITGMPSGVTQPAHIHTGSCANLGGVKYPLTFPMNGTSVTTLDMPLSQLLGQLPLAVNIHKSSADINTYVSCGDITASGSAAANQPATTPPSTGPAQKQPAPSQPAPSSQSYPGY